MSWGNLRSLLLKLNQPFWNAIGLAEKSVITKLSTKRFFLGPEKSTFLEMHGFRRTTLISDIHWFIILMRIWSLTGFPHMAFSFKTLIWHSHATLIWGHTAAKWSSQEVMPLIPLVPLGFLSLWETKWKSTLSLWTGNLNHNQITSTF